MTIRVSKNRVDMGGAQMRWSKGADVASSTTLTLSNGNYFDITGTTTVTSISAITVGTVVRLHFDDALTLTHNATTLILPGGANITTATGDQAEFVEYATGDWRCSNYTKVDGTAVVSAGGGGQQSVQVFTASGTWTKPAGLKFAEIICTGGGSGGAGAPGINNCGGSGGGGGTAIKFIVAGSLRSEERRVGKECRSRWSPYH